LADLEPGQDPGSVRAAAASAILSARVDVGRFDADVFVGDLTNARGLSFQLVCFLGAADRGFPAPPRIDPILDDETRQSINRSGEGHIRPGVDTTRAEALLFQLLLQSAAERLV